MEKNPLELFNQMTVKLIEDSVELGKNPYNEDSVMGKLIDKLKNTSTEVLNQFIIKHDDIVYYKLNYPDSVSNLEFPMSRLKCIERINIINNFGEFNNELLDWIGDESNYYVLAF